jgi:hypothetical protein
VALLGLGLPLEEIKSAFERDGTNPRPGLLAQLERFDR